MACLDLDSPQLFSNSQSYDGPFNLHLDENISVELLAVSDASTSSLSDNASKSPPFDNVPKPPPPPRASYSKSIFSKRLTGKNCFLDETRHAWDRLFNEGYKADVHVLTDDNGLILAHSIILGITSPVLRSMLEQAKIRGGFRCIKIHGVPTEAARAFIRFLYSSWYDPEDTKQYVLHLLILSHTFTVPSLKKACANQLEKAFLTSQNVVDVLQLARQCDAPRLSMICTRLIIKDFKTISTSEGWKVMRQANPVLEQELLESLVEEDSKRQEKHKKMEERKVYMQLYEAMETLLHIFREGCRTVGPRDKMLKDSQAPCNFSACRALESLVRHFSNCKLRVPGGCLHCKRMWQLLELHSRMCSEPDSCKVPLCRHFKDKMQRQSKKEEVKWKLLVRRVMESKGRISSISAWRSFVA